MNPVKSVTDTLRSNFYATVLAVASLGALSSCGGEESEPQPVAPKIENLSGALSEGNDGVTKTLNFRTTLVESVLGVSFRMKDEATGDIYIVETSKTDPGAGNATMTLSEVDVITDESKLSLASDKRVIDATPTKQIVGTINFEPGYENNETQVAGHLYGLKKIQFTANEVSLYESGQEAKLEYLADKNNKEIFKQVMRGFLGSVNDNDLVQAGNQRMPLHVSVKKFN